MPKTKIMNYLYKRAYNADLKKRCIEELMDILNEDNPTPHDYIEMIIRARFMLDTANTVADMTGAKYILNQIYDDFYEKFPEDYAWYINDLYEKGE